MKYLISCIVLAICLVGCGEKPKFSINKKDTIEAYANNSIFTKVINEDNSKLMGYKFNSAPESVYGIKTNDLNVVGGYVFSRSSSDSPTISLFIKGKGSFDKLLERVSNSEFLKGSKQNNAALEKGYGYNWVLNDAEHRQGVSVIYNPFFDNATFMIINY